MTIDRQTAEAYRECARRTRGASSTFYVAFLSLPRELRHAIYATYAFCRLCDDVVDEPAADRDPAKELYRIQHALLGADSAPAEHAAIFTALHHAIDRFELNQQHYIDVIDGCRMDLAQVRYADFDELEAYCRRVASAVGIICVSIFGYTSPEAVARAYDLGIAFQLTNILRDVREDYANGRIYLPQDELSRFDVTEADIAAADASARFRALMAFQIDRARSYYARGEQVMPMLRQGRHCIGIMSSFYSRILDKIAAADGDVLSARVGLSSRDKAALAVSTVARGVWRSVAR